MIDLKLSFPDEATGLAALEAAGLGELDAVVAPIYPIATPEVRDANEEVVTPAVFVPGWHADARLLSTDAVPAALAPYVVHPSKPQHTWAGGR